MKNLLAFLFIGLFLSSCSTTYYYSTIDSSSVNIFKADNGNFNIENDTVLVSYSFNGINAPVRISIYNKTDDPLYIDWQRSALIIKDVATSYQGNKVPISGSTENSSYGGGYYFDTRYSSGSFSGSAILPAGLTFIPPKSKIEHQSLKLKLVNFDSFEKDKYSTMTIKNKSHWNTNIGVINFKESESPLTFRSYLTLYNEKEGLFTMEHSFYLSNLIKTKGTGPDSMPSDLANRGDIFYVERHSDGGSVAAAVVFTGLLVGTAAVVSSASETNE